MSAETLVIVKWFAESPPGESSSKSRKELVPSIVG
jgi:hypothetical protein